MWWSEFLRLFETNKSTTFSDKNWEVLWKNVPKTDFSFISDVSAKFSKHVWDSMILSSQIVSEWWIMAALVHMIMPNQKDTDFDIWVDIDLSYSNLWLIQELFSESLGVLVEVDNDLVQSVLDNFWKHAVVIWKTSPESNLKIWKNWDVFLDRDIHEIYDIWSNGLRKFWN